MECQKIFHFLYNSLNHKVWEKDISNQLWRHNGFAPNDTLK